MYFVFIVLTTWKISKCLWIFLIQNQGKHLLDGTLQPFLYFYVPWQVSKACNTVRRRINKSSSHIQAKMKKSLEICADVNAKTFIPDSGLHALYLSNVLCFTQMLAP